MENDIFFFITFYLGIYLSLPNSLSTFSVLYQGTLFLSTLRLFLFLLVICFACNCQKCFHFRCTFYLCLTFLIYKFLDSRSLFRPVVSVSLLSLSSPWRLSCYISSLLLQIYKTVFADYLRYPQSVSHRPYSTGSFYHYSFCIHKVLWCFLLVCLILIWTLPYSTIRDVFGRDLVPILYFIFPSQFL